ncbi:hypothetical protein NM688_g634 [Phlebia brevispora]|uniref:Uncharacterized protein n=1 Tax=Phlebia brevispora TaxID=194682 RepID=A0ACC1TDY1_9APHY|nr:hypothetical protein NM688_g634 [Phlebia brevispora]
MRPKHTPHSLSAFPVYSSAFVSTDELVLGGGGGQTRSGIKNKLVGARNYDCVAPDREISLLDEYELQMGEDAPMSMAANPKTHEIICGVNSALDALETVKNQNCRKFRVADGKLSFEASQSTLTYDPDNDDDDFQKITVFSPGGELVAVAGSRDLSVLRFPSLEPAATALRLSKGEIYDATFSSSNLVVATTVNLMIYAVPSASEADDGTSEKQAGKQKEISLELDLVQTIERPTLPGTDAGSSFRAVRYHPSNPTVLYTVLNTVPQRTRSKHSPRRAFVCKWNTDNWEVTKLRKVSDRNVTCFDVSPDGRFLAFGSSDYTVGVLDAQTLAPLLTILKAHEFPPTTLKFNPTSSLLISGSADSTVRVIAIPDQLVGASWSSWIIVIVTLLVILFAIIAQQMHQAYQ